MRLFLPIVLAASLLHGCSDGSSVPSTTGPVGESPKNQQSILSISDNLDSAYTAHSLGCQAVLDSMVSGYIDFNDPTYGDKIKMVINTKLSAYFGRAESVLHDSAWVADTVVPFDSDTVSDISATGKDILHDVDSLINLYDAGTMTKASVQSALSYQRSRAIGLSTYDEQRKVGTGVATAQSSIDFWSANAALFDDYTGNQNKMRDSDKRILTADRDGAILGFFSGLFMGAYAGGCYGSIYEGLKIGFGW